MSPDIVATMSGPKPDDLDLRQTIFLECKERATLLYFLVRLGAAELEQFKERSVPMSDVQYEFEVKQMEKDFNDRNEELGHALVIMNTAAKGPGVSNVPAKTEWLLHWLPKKGSPHLVQGPRNLQEIFWPAMPMPTFTRVYSRFRKYTNHSANALSLYFDGHHIGLHSLHTEVCAAGGSQLATDFELWPVIGAKLGFVHYPAVDCQPARSKYNVAVYLQNMYMQHLDEFTKACIAVVKEVNVAPWPPVENPAGTDTPVTPYTLSPDIDAQSKSPASSHSSPGLPLASTSVIDRSADKSTQQIVNVEQQNVPDNNDSLPPGRRQLPRPMRWNLPGQVVYSHVTAPFPYEHLPGRRPIIPKPDVPLTSGRFPTEDELHQGVLFIGMLCQICSHNIDQINPVTIPDERKEEYNAGFKILHQAMMVIEPKLPLWACRYPAHCMSRIIIWFVATRRQSAESISLFTLFSVQVLSKLMPLAAMHAPYEDHVESQEHMPTEVQSSIVDILMKAPFGLPRGPKDVRCNTTAT